MANRLDVIALACAVSCLVGGGCGGPSEGEDETASVRELALTRSSGAPTGLVATATPTGVTLTWNAVQGATSYAVYRTRSAGGSYSRVGSTSTPSYHDAAVSAGRTYWYEVAARSSSGTGPRSASVSVAIPTSSSPPAPTPTSTPTPTPTPTVTPAPTPSPSPTPTTVPPVGSASRVWGVTIDNPWNTSATVTSLKQLPRRALARVVLDEPQAGLAPSDYVEPFTAIHGVADTMAEILDSEYVSRMSVADYTTRTSTFLGLLGGQVDVWEIGNEINGDWLGATADVTAKMTGAYNLVKAQGKPAALTLYYTAPGYTDAAHDMFTWAAANIPASMKSGLDYVLVSYYEDDNGGYQPDWPTVFHKLAQMFPNSKIGMGECGTTTSSLKSTYLQRYYTLSVNEPQFVGGAFWWYYSEDMVPASTPLWQQFAGLMTSSQ